MGAILGRMVSPALFGWLSWLATCTGCFVLPLIWRKHRGNVGLLLLISSALFGLFKGYACRERWERGLEAGASRAGEVISVRGKASYLWDRALWTVEVMGIDDGRERMVYAPPIVVGLRDRRQRLDQLDPAEWSGAVIQGRGVWVELGESMNPGERSALESARGDGISGWWDISSADMPFRLVPAPWYKNRFARFRVSIQTFLQEQIAASVDTPDDALAAELWKAILLGRRTDLPDDLLHRFRHAGIMHLLVVSGLHVGLVAALSVAMMRWLLRFPPLAARTVSILPVVGYVMIAGGSPPALRAGMMYILWAAAGLFRRHSTVSVTAFWTAASFAVFWPRHGSRVGLQISFTIVAALMFWGPLLFEQMPRLLMPDPFKPRSLWSSRDVTAAQFSRWLRLSLSASLAALFGLIPWARAVFGLVTPASIIVNAIAIPWTSMILFTGALAHGIHALFGITTGFRWLFLMISGLARIADWGSGLPGGSWVVSVAGWDPWTLLVIILMVVACLFLVWFRRWTMFWFGAALLGGALMVSYAPATRCPDVVLFHTAGTGPCAFFRTGRDILMVDGGGSYFGRNVLRGFRRAWPCSPRVRFVLTRNRMDHAGGFLSLAGQYDGSLGLWVLDATGRSQAARRMMAEIPHAEEALGEEAPEWIAPFRVRTEDAGGLLVEFGDTVWWLTERLPARLPESAAGHWVVRIVPYRASLGALQRIPYAPSGAICVIQSNRFGGGADENAIRWAFQERGWKVLSTGTCGAVIQRSQGTIESWKGYSGE